MDQRTLIEGFESDIRHNCHGLSSSVGRSSTGKEIIALEKAGLALIGEHLRSQGDNLHDPMLSAWTMLAERVAWELKIKVPLGQFYSDREFWIRWLDEQSHT